LGGALSVVSLTAATLFVVRHRLEKTCRRVPLSSLPRSSACRNFVENSASATTSVSPKAWGLDQTRLLPSWPPGEDRGPITHWIPSFVAVQMDLPEEILSANSRIPETSGDVLPLAKSLLAAFLDARAAGPEPWILDRDVPSLSFAPGHRLFGVTPEPGAFLLGTWSNVSGEHIDPLAVPDSAPRPVAAFPSNRELVKQGGSEVPAAGSVLYWRAGQVGVKLLDWVAGLAFPEGGFQELIVERVADGKVRVSYVSAEVTTCRQEEGQKEQSELRRLPWPLYELHVMYAQSLLAGAARQL
ncbi:hypothetical protein B0T18DRAFT_311322, partial [Schizothecium vesticola]